MHYIYSIIIVFTLKKKRLKFIKFVFENFKFNPRTNGINPQTNEIHVIYKLDF